jgi:hypothetical protein
VPGSDRAHDDADRTTIEDELDDDEREEFDDDELEDDELDELDDANAASTVADPAAPPDDATIDDPGVEDIAEDAFDVWLAQGSDRDRDLIIDPAPYTAADQAQGFHGDGEVVLTIVENQFGPLTKTYGVAPDGSIKPNGRPTTGCGRMVRARLSRTKPMASLDAVLSRLKDNQCLMMGTWPGDAVMRRMLLKRRWEKLTDAERDPAGDGPLYRGGCIAYQPGQPALMVLDFDAKDWPDALQQKVAQVGGPHVVLAQFHQQWRRAGFLARPSVSHGIRNKRTGQITPGGGLHVYVSVKDGADIPRYVRTLFAWLVANGFGYGFVTAAGHFLLRTLIDPAASGVPYWLAFEHDAVLADDRLEHIPGARRCKFREGPLLDTGLRLDLTVDEQREVDANTAALRAAKQPEIKAKRLARGAPEIARLKRLGVPQVEAEHRVLASAELGRLPVGGWVYHFDDGRRVTGREVLAHPARFDGATSADPLEPWYPHHQASGIITRNKAEWKIGREREDRGMFVFSQGTPARSSSWRMTPSTSSNGSQG